MAALRAAGADARFVPADVSRRDDVRRLVAQTVGWHGGVDIVVNNAAIGVYAKTIEGTDEDEWDRVIAINLKSVYACSRAAVKHMMRARSGCIINISSVSGIMGNAGQANYAASKAGIVGFTKSVAREVASRGITANAVAPGFIETAMASSLEEEVREAIRGQIPMARLGSAEEVADSVAFLVSPQASYITGQVLHVNGGLYV